MFNQEQDPPLNLVVTTHLGASSRASSSKNSRRFKEFMSPPQPEKENFSPLPPNKGAKNQKKIMHRTYFTRDMYDTLEKEYRKEDFISSERKSELATQLNISKKSVQLWFQNRRKKRELYHPSSLEYVPRSVHYPYLNNPPYNPSMHLSISTAAMAEVQQAMLLHNNILQEQAQMLTRLETSSQRNREQSGSHGFIVE